MLEQFKVYLNHKRPPVDETWYVKNCISCKYHINNEMNWHLHFCVYPDKYGCQKRSGGWKLGVLIAWLIIMFIGILLICGIVWAIRLLIGLLR